MKILFIGTVDFSRITLEKLIQMKEDVVGIITMEKSDLNSDFSNLSSVCKKNNIIFKITDNVNSDDLLTWIRNLALDYIFCFGWSQLLKKEILSIPKKGVIGYHPSNLPENRGRHPIIWALVLGLDETASTFFFMDEKADNGNIISQKSVKIEYEDDAASLYVKLTRTALAQLDEFVPLLKKDAVPQIKQDASKANYWRKRDKFDGKIDFRMNSKAIYNLVRGLTRPYPGAHAVYKDTEIKIWKVKEVFSTFENNIEPGKILDILPSGNILVKACDNAIEIIEHSSTTFPLKGEYFV